MDLSMLGRIEATRPTPAPAPPVAAVIHAGRPPMSDDLWTALHQHRSSACQKHSVWADQCAEQHGLAVAA